MTFKSLTLAGILALSAVSPAFASPEANRQFPDVEPTNWAYQAILNLRERYGCVAGFPDGSFRPGQSATRAQLAALVNSCLDNITSYVDEKDAALAEALRTEFRAELAKLNTRVTELEVARARKQLGVGTYVGAGLTLGSRPDLNNVNGLGNPFVPNTIGNSTYAGLGIQGRFPVIRSGELNAVSVRPFVGFTGSDFGGMLINGGGTVTYDLSIGRRTLPDGTKVSSTNLYAGVGYGASQTYGVSPAFGFKPVTRNLVNRTVQTDNNAIGVIGVETSVGNNAVVFVDVKLPFSSNDVNDSYNATGIVGFGLKL